MEYNNIKSIHFLYYYTMFMEKLLYLSFVVLMITTLKKISKIEHRMLLKLYDEDIFEIQQNQKNMQLIDEVSLNIIN